MKTNIIYCLLGILLLSCKNDKKSNNKPESYINTLVGTVSNDGKFICADDQQIRDKWQHELSKRNPDLKLANFEIVEGTAQGDELQTYYMLVSRENSGSITCAALLSLKDKEFYFKTTDGTDGTMHTILMCEGECKEGCKPIITINSGTIYLSCSPCLDCTKLERGMS